MIDIFKISPMGEILLNYFGEGVIVFKYDYIHRKKQSIIIKYLINRFSNKPESNILYKRLDNCNNKNEDIFIILSIFNDEIDLYSLTNENNDEKSSLLAIVYKDRNVIDIKYDISTSWKPIHYGECSYISLNEFIKNHVEFL